MALMAGHYFISYSSVDGAEFALRLCDALIAGPPSIPAWLDKRELRPGQDWDEQIVEAIRACEGLLFVMTPDSVEPQSVCKNEWTRALKYKKPSVPIRLDREAEMPFRLGVRQHIDFTDDFEPALAQLRTHLTWLTSPEGKLQTLKDRLAEADRDLRRARDDVEETRIRAEIEDLNRAIAEQQRVVDDPEGTARRVEESIERGLERERQPERPVAGEARTKFINPPPGVAPDYFQDRFVEMGLIGAFLKNESQRLMTVVGRAGIGKTAMACRVLKSLEGGELPDDGGPLSVDGILYLNSRGSHRLTVPELYGGLLKLLPDETAGELEGLYKKLKATTEAKMAALLEAFPGGRVVVLLDNFEDVVDPETSEVNDEELDEALRAWLELPHHGVKAILTTRVAPRDLTLVEPGRQTRLELDSGLESPYAENILREMDVDGKVGLRGAPDDLLDEARRRTRGYPRALEALFAILSADRYTTLEEVLDDAEALLPENVVEALVGAAFERLDPTSQHVMEALAVYGRPVTPTAVDYLLQPYLPGVDSAPVLNRLVTMHFAWREGGRYYLHPVDRAYAQDRVPEGEEPDRLLAERSPYTQFALLHRGAEYFKRARKPESEWKTIEDLAPLLAEFDLRCAGHDYDTAARVLIEVDADYLFRWGHYRSMADMHERLQGRLGSPSLEYKSVGRLGTAYDRLGQTRRATACYEQVLAIARGMQERKGEGVWLGNLGGCYADLGEIDRAIEQYEQALDISREVGDRNGEGVWLGNLGNQYANLGQTARATEYFEQALGIAREVRYQLMESTNLCRLGICYADLGRATHAIEYCDQALGIAREINYRYIEAVSLGCKGDVFVDLGDLNHAKEFYDQAIQIADEISNVQYQNAGRADLARALLYAGDLAAARAAIEEAQQYDLPLNNHRVQALLGVIALRQGDRPVAKVAFGTAVEQADTLLAHTAQNYAAWDVKGLALCGLALLESDRVSARNRVAEAANAYRAARAINADAGVVGRVLRLLDALALANPTGEEILAEARVAAGGEGAG
jgi:tetratricopeptide (TPR) repeat protein